jgi:hypothetical protein
MVFLHLQNHKCYSVLNLKVCTLGYFKVSDTCENQQAVCHLYKMGAASISPSEATYLSIIVKGVSPFFFVALSNRQIWPGFLSCS